MVATAKKREAWLRAMLCATLSVGVSACYDIDGDELDDAGESDASATEPEPTEDAGDTYDAGEAYDAGDDYDGASDAGEPAGEVAGDLFALTSAGRLLHLDRDDGAIARALTLSGIPEQETVLGGDIRPANGALYVLTSAGKLYTVDLASGASKLAASLSADTSDTSAPFAGLMGERFGVDFNPVPDRLRIVSDQGQNLRVNVESGATTTDGALNPATPGVRAAAYTQSFAAACRTRLYVIDAENGKLLVQDPPNDGTLSVQGALGVAASAASSLEIATSAEGKDRALLALSDAHGTQILDVDLSSGAAANARHVKLKKGELLLTLAAPPPATAPAQAPGELLGLLESGAVVSFNRAAPGKLCTSVPLSGLAAGEHALGMDVRPADGALYVLSDAGKLYTVDPSSGAASLKSTLVADAADGSDPFSALGAEDVAVGFNPVPDRLRIVTSAGLNLRVNVDTGATTTDGAISGASLTALAYTNSFAGARSTTLYALDTQADSLARIGGDPATGGACPADPGNPNCGVVTSIGALALPGDVTGVDAFDIDAKTGSALAALSLAGATRSTLYSIDLRTGSASLPAGVANGTIGGGARLRGLAFRANPELNAFAVTDSHQLLRFKPALPGTLTSQVAITGLGEGEVLLGIDLRPADGKLYALGSKNRLYTLDAQSGAASLVAELRAATGDDAPFSGLSACSFGVDFNPVPDLLRVVSDAGDNLRVFPSARGAALAGDVISDSPLNPGTPMVSAAAYSNAFAGATQTTLYVVDATDDSLWLQGGPLGMPSPNTGTLSSVGKLGVDASEELAFDIVGGHNGLALLATRSSATSSSLFVLNLASGAATPVQAMNSEVGGSAGGIVTGLALELK